MNSSSVLAIEIELARVKFEQAKLAGVLSGNFDDSSWNFKSRRLIFSSRSSVRSDELGVSMASICIGKAFILQEIARKFDYSAELILGRLIAFRCLAEEVDRHGWEWSSLAPHHFDRVVKALKEKYSASSVYHRAGGLMAIAAYLNAVRAVVAGKEVPFVRRHIKWKHCLENPIRAMQDPTSRMRECQRKEKYQEDLPQCLAAVRARLAEDPSLEPSPGYDLIRLEAQAFMLALGLRVGEVTALPVHALDEDSVPGSLLLRVPVEKGGEANAMPVPAVWDDPVRKAYLYLLEACAEARAHAKLIEESGFSFIESILSAHRAREPVSDVARCQMRVARLEENRHFSVKEITACFPLSAKQFAGDGRYKASLVAISKPMASRIVEWLDERFRRQDWLSHSRSKLRKFSRSFVVNDLADALSVKAGNICKQPFFDDLRTFLRSMSQAGFFDPDVQVSEKVASSVSSSWCRLRSLMLSVRGGAHGTVVDLVALQALLSSQYAGYVSRHFDELVSEEDDLGGDTAKDHAPKRSGVSSCPRPGMAERLGDHLIVVWDGQFATDRPRGLVPRPLFRADVYNYLRANSQKTTVFERLGIRDAQGRIASFTPHMIRHWVTTAMLRSGPNELAVDMWMNRSPRQGRSYDHRTAKERAESIRSLYLSPVPPSDYLGRRVSGWRLQGMSEEEIVSLISQKLRVVHFTPWGSCSRDLYTSPCSRGLMCLRGFGTGAECSSFQVDVKDSQAKQRIERLLQDHELMLRAIEPHYVRVANAIREELDTTMPLDQHLAYIVDVVRGCRSALSKYVEAEPKGGLA